MGLICCDVSGGSGDDQCILDEVSLFITPGEKLFQGVYSAAMCCIDTDTLVIFSINKCTPTLEMSGAQALISSPA